MKFETRTGKQRSRRSKRTLQAPAVVETLEIRSLLTQVALTGPMTGAPPVINDATPIITWEADGAAASYDLWITDAEQRTAELIERGIPQNSFTPADDLNLGLTRVWVRSNYSDGSSSAWSPPTLFVVQPLPTVIGPVNSDSIRLLNQNDLTETKPTIEWTSPPGAVRFEIYLKDLTTLTKEIITLKVAPELDNNPSVDSWGGALPDTDIEISRPAGNKYAYELPDDLLMGSYRVFVRSVDDGGRYSDWSAPHEFNVAPQVEVLRPAAPTFQSSPAVELTISGTPTSGTYTIALTSTGANAQTLRTAPLPYNATTAQVQAAVRLMNGFQLTKVTTSGASPNFTHLLSFPVAAGASQVGAASVTKTFNTGTVTSRTTAARTILLEWKPVDGATHYEVWVGRVAASGAVSGLYFAPNLTTTSYQIPDLLPEGDYVFKVRAKRRHQVTEINLTGTPTSGSYRIVLTTPGTEGTTQRTAPISYNATAAQIKAAVVALEGFENADVVSDGTTPNVRYLLQIRQTSGAVAVKVVGSINPGTLTGVTYSRPEVIGLSSDKSEFSTMRVPEITAPKGVMSNAAGQPLVTEARPTIEWTPIDKAARYEIWVDLSHATKTYLITQSTTTSYKFEQDLQPGKYQVWVRAASTTGVLTGWSKAYSFEATGGAPAITSPVANASVVPIPNITWTEVPDAASYEIWFAWVGEDYDYIVADGIAAPNYSPTGSLPTGTYRVWVRAIKSDGSALPWSAPVTFGVAANEVEKMEVEVPELLVALLPPTGNSRTNADAETMAGDPIEPESRNEVNSGVRLLPETVAALPTSAVVEMSSETEGFIQQLAAQCTTAEWWISPKTES